MKTASRIKLVATVASVVRASTRPGAPPVMERVQAVPRLVRATVEGRYAGTTLGRLGLVAAAVAYVASPVDLLPEALLPVIGAADDAVVITWAIKVFLEETDRFIAWEIGQGLHRPTATTGRGLRGWSRVAPPSGSDAASATIPGMPLGSAADAPARAWAGGVQDGLRRDRDVTGAAAPGRVAASVRRVAARVSPSSGGGQAGSAQANGADARPSEPGRLPEGMRQVATDYVLESVRKRLER